MYTVIHFLYFIYVIQIKQYNKLFALYLNHEDIIIFKFFWEALKVPCNRYWRITCSAVLKHLFRESTKIAATLKTFWYSLETNGSLFLHSPAFISIANTFITNALLMKWHSRIINKLMHNIFGFVWRGSFSEKIIFAF